MFLVPFVLEELPGEGRGCRGGAGREPPEGHGVGQELLPCLAKACVASAACPGGGKAGAEVSVPQMP